LAFIGALSCDPHEDASVFLLGVGVVAASALSLFTIV
jgi:hypothetical protein